MSWILTRTGRRFDLLQPCPSQVFVLDIAHALAHLCRFNGHTSRHYSVAQHSLLVASIVPPEHQLAALLHDATEAYVGDMVRPLKQLMPEYQQIEQRIWLAICERFDIAPELPECVKEADMIALATERAQLMPDHPGDWECLAGVAPLPDAMEHWTPQQAQTQYLNRLLELLQSPTAPAAPGSASTKRTQASRRRCACEESVVIEELKPCPFCGQQDAFVEQLDSDASVVICQGVVDEHSACLARGPVGVQEDEREDQPGKDAAIREWNRRAQPAEAEGTERWNGLKLAAEAAEEDGPWEPRIGMTDFETAFAQSASPTKVLELIAALSAVTDERDAERDQAREWLEEHYELQAERDQLRAEVERYVPLHEAIQRAAGELPEGWAIQLYIERNGGGVELIGPDGTVDFATNNERLDYTVIDALEAAMAAKEA